MKLFLKYEYYKHLFIPNPPSLLPALIPRSDWREEKNYFKSLTSFPPFLKENEKNVKKFEQWNYSGSQTTK